MSGEIVERRSLVIRSKTPVAVDDEPTEISVTPFPVVVETPVLPVAPRSRWRIRWLVAAIACGVAAGVLFVLARPAAQTTTALEADAAMIGTMLDAQARAAVVKVQAIAKSPMLRAAIDTDAGTLADMARDNDVVFPVERGEVIEVFQVRGGTRALLLRLPSGAPELPAVSATNARLAVTNHAVAVLANAAVQKDQSDVSGEVVLSVPVDVAPLTKVVSEHTPAAELQGLDEPIVLRPGNAVPNHMIPIPMRSITTQLSLAAHVPKPIADLTFVWLCAGAALLLLLIFIIASLRRAAG